MKQGIYTGISNEEYHGGVGYSKSQLDMVAAAPGLLDWSKKAPRDNSSTASTLGTALHTLLLEPELFSQQFVCEPKGTERRSNVGKANAQLFEDEAKRLGQQILKIEDLDMLHAQADSVMAHPEARALLESKVGKAELSAYWIDPDTGLLCRCRPDWWAYPEVIVDVKTTDYPAAYPFGKSVMDYRYHVQDAFYTDGCTIASGTQIEEFLFLAVGKKREMGRYPVHLHRLAPRAKDLGRALYRQDLNTIAACQDQIGPATGAWPAIEHLDLPAYAYNNYQD